MDTVPARKCTILVTSWLLISSLEGIPLVYDLVPANVDERQAADELLDRLSGFDSFRRQGLYRPGYYFPPVNQDGELRHCRSPMNASAQPPDKT